MTEIPGNPEGSSSATPPTPPAAPLSDAAPPIPPPLGAAPAPPPLAPQYQPATQQRRRGPRTVGLIAAVVAIGLKIALGFGAAHFLSHGSGSGIVITLVVVIVLGFVLRRIRF